MDGRRCRWTRLWRWTRAGRTGARRPAPPTFTGLYNPAAAAAAKKLGDKDDPTLKCIPTALGTLNVSMFDVGAVGQIVSTPKFVVMLTETFHGFRLVPTDGRPHREEVPPSYRGDSVGRWEGDVFVVDTKNFTDDTWMWAEGRVSPHSDQLRIVERYRRVDRNTLEIDATVYDPKVLTGAVDGSEADAGARAVRSDHAADLSGADRGARRPSPPLALFATRTAESLIHTARSSRRGESPS